MAEPRTPPRWWQRAVPASALAVVVAVAVALTAVPDRELELSTTRVPQAFLELELAAPRASVCTGERARVRFRLTSRLAQAEQLRWTVRLDPLERSGRGDRPKARRPVRERGRAPVDPGAARLVRTSLPTPRAPYTVTVRIQDHPELLRVHCRGSRR